MSEWTLPFGWTRSTLADLGVWRGGGTPSKQNSSYWTDGTIPWVSPKDMKVLRITSTQDTITEAAIRNSSATLLPASSVAVVTRSGILERTLPVAVIEVVAAVNQDLKVLIPKAEIDPSFVAYFLRGRERDVLGQCMKNGTTVARIDFGRFLAFAIPVPSLHEQRQIVSEIETQFARLDAAVAALKSARIRLKRYRASVLKAACEGRLVPTDAELARRNGREYETASVLLERIKAERAASPDKKRGKAKEAVALDNSKMPEIPEGWTWTTPEMIRSENRYALAIGPFGSNLKVNDYREAGVPLIFVRNIRTGIFSCPSAKYVDHDKAIELQAHTVQEGDVLITKMGDPPGDAIVYPPGLPRAIITADCIRFQLDGHIANSRFIQHLINSEHGRREFQRLTRGVAQQKVSLARFRECSLPLPPLAEQERIVAEVERRMSVIEQMEALVETNLKRAETLRQSILRMAFSGRLVSQASAGAIEREIEALQGLSKPAKVSPSSASRGDSSLRSE